MGYPLFVEPVVSDLPKKRRTVLSPAPANVQAGRHSESRSELSGRNRLTPAQWMQRYGPDHTTAARLRRTREVPRPINLELSTSTEMAANGEVPMDPGIAVSPEIPVLNALEAFCRMHESLQAPYERRLRRVLVPRFDQLRTWTQEMIAELAATQRRLHGRGESHLWPSQRERVRSRWLVRLADFPFVGALTSSQLDALRMIRREINAVASVNGPAALARVRLRAVRNRRWNASPMQSASRVPAERPRPSETDSQYLVRHLNDLRERWRVDEASTQRGSQNMDGLGDRERSPEDAWTTLRYTMTPDPELPSNSSSFTSMPNTTQRSFEQPEESRGVHWLDPMDDMDIEEADRLLPPTANGEPDCDIVDGIDDNPTRSRRPAPAQSDALESAPDDWPLSRDRPSLQRRSISNNLGASSRRRASRVVFGGLEDEARAIDAERQAPNNEDREADRTASPQRSMERFMSRIEERLGHTPTQGEWEGQLSVGADDDEEDEQTPRAVPTTQRGDVDVMAGFSPLSYHQAGTPLAFSSIQNSAPGELGTEEEEESRSRWASTLAQILTMTDEESAEAERLQLHGWWERHDEEDRRRVERERAEDEQRHGREEVRRREGEGEEAHRSRLLELMQSGGASRGGREGREEV